MVLQSGWPDAALWFQLCDLGLFSFFKYRCLNLRFFALLRGVVGRQQAVLGGSRPVEDPAREPRKVSPRNFVYVQSMSPGAAGK